MLGDKYQQSPLGPNVIPPLGLLGYSLRVNIVYPITAMYNARTTGNSIGSVTQGTTEGEYERRANETSSIKKFDADL